MLIHWLKRIPDTRRFCHMETPKPTRDNRMPSPAGIATSRQESSEPRKTARQGDVRKGELYGKRTGDGGLRRRCRRHGGCHHRSAPRRGSAENGGLAERNFQ